ncbi:hypothetical protein JL720_2515 [Aureococcus anophagefferens]|nr:hypothetical protein JL720_2515 [Aureococcus anophagefferens]
MEAALDGGSDGLGSPAPGMTMAEAASTSLPGVGEPRRTSAACPTTPSAAPASRRACSAGPRPARRGPGPARRAPTAAPRRASRPASTTATATRPSRSPRRGGLPLHAFASLGALPYGAVGGAGGPLAAYAPVVGGVRRALRRALPHGLDASALAQYQAAQALAQASSYGGGDASSAPRRAASLIGRGTRDGARATSPWLNPNMRHGRWSEEEHKQFLDLMTKYGRSWTRISQVMMTRTEPQVRSHAQKHFLRVNRQSKAAEAARPGGADGDDGGLAADGDALDGEGKRGASLRRIDRRFGASRPNSRILELGPIELSDGSTLAQPVSLSQLGLPPEAGGGGLGAAGTAGLSLGADGVSQASIAQMSLLQQQAQLQAAQRSQQPFFFPQTPGSAPASEAPAPPGAAASARARGAEGRDGARRSASAASWSARLVDVDDVPRVDEEQLREVRQRREQVGAPRVVAAAARGPAAASAQQRARGGEVARGGESAARAAPSRPAAASRPSSRSAGSRAVGVAGGPGRLVARRVALGGLARDGVGEARGDGRVDVRAEARRHGLRGAAVGSGGARPPAPAVARNRATAAGGSSPSA